MDNKLSEPREDLNICHTPVIAVCGWSGSGKTWLLENLIQRFSRQGFYVGIVKHDAHQLELDHPCKNSYRLWQAGAQSLIAHDEDQWFLRNRKTGAKSLAELAAKTAHEVDFILVEGHKGTALPKIWLDHPQKPGIPDDLQNVMFHLPYDDMRIETAEDIILKAVHEQWKLRPVYAGILVGGKSARMGYPKQSMEINGKPVLQTLFQAVSSQVKQIVLLGTHSFSGQYEYPTLPDIPDAEGPMAGILSAFRWNPYASWIFIACDMPNVQPRTIEWLLQQRKFGRWGVLPKDDKHIHPLLAVYEPSCVQKFESCVINGKYSMMEAINHEKIEVVSIPNELHQDWINCNSPDDWIKAMV